MNIKRYLMATLVALPLTIGTANAVVMELVSNGGFETGNLAGWTTSGLGTGNCPAGNNDWNVSNVSSTGCNPVSNPVGSAFAAYVQNDGAGPLNYLLQQSFAVSVAATGGSFSFDLSQINNSDPGRTLTVSLEDQTTLATTVLYGASTTSNNIAWQTFAGDISAFIASAAGHVVTLTLDNFIPGNWTGPAGLGIDNVSITQNVAEPATLGLLGLCLAGLGFRRRSTAA